MRRNDLVKNLKDLGLFQESKYKVTGKLYGSERWFRAIRTDSFRYAMGINLWRGSVWEWTGKKWKLIKRVHN